MSEDSKATPGGAGRSGRQRRQRTEYRNDGEAARRGLRFIVLPVVGLAVLGIAVGLLGKPAYRKYREAKGRSLGIHAGKEFEAGRVAVSVRELRLALQMAPEDSVVMRNAARILATENVPDALVFWEKIFQKEEGTLEDRLQYSALAIRLRRPARAQEQLAMVLKEDPHNLPAQRMQMEVREATGDLAGAIQVARAIVAHDGNPTNRYFLGEILVKSSRSRRSDGSVTADQVKWAEEGSGILLPLAMSEGPLQSPAAATLADSVTLQGEAARRVESALSQKSERSPADILSLAVIQSKASPQKTEGIAARMVQELAKEALPVRLRAMDWLSGVGRPNLAAQLLHPTDVETNLAAAHVEMDLALKNRNWPRIKEVLAKPPVGLANSLSNILSAAVAVVENRAPTAEKLLRTAIDAAAGSVAADSELDYLGRSAEQIGLPRVAIAAHEARLTRGAAVMDASDNILRLVLLEQGRDPQFPGLLHQYPALQARHAAAPEDLGIASQYYYVASVLGRDLAKVQSGWAALRKQFPERPEPLLGLAMVTLKSGGVPEATRLIEENPVDFTTLPVRVKPLMIHLLGSTGQKELARSLAQKVELAQYFYEERELVTPWLAR